VRLTAGRPRNKPARDHMSIDERIEKAETGKVQEAVNRGIVRPPFVYLCAIVMGILRVNPRHSSRSRLERGQVRRLVVTSFEL
jgi:hypothetical protein